MAKPLSRLLRLLSRLVKVVMVAVLVPLAIGLFTGGMEQLSVGSPSGATGGAWLWWGFVTYVGIHLLLYRPVSVFRVSHRMFSTLAVWLFGGQVASVEGAAGGPKGKSAKAEKDGAGEKSQGSTLVAFSPYVIPFYTILVCVASWVLRQWVERGVLDGATNFLIGLTIAFHWLMTADELQQQRDRWHIETYLLAIGLVFVVTLVVVALSLPLAIPEFSFVRALSDGWANTQAIYTTLIHRLFL